MASVYYVARLALVLAGLSLLASGSVTLYHEEEEGTDEFVALQSATPVSAASAAVAALHDAGNPHLVKLRRESVPVYRKGKVASFKTSYSGILAVGSPAQEFRVVFDTGSGHVILPAAECKSESCLVHRRYNMTSSATSQAINSDGSLVPPGELCDQVTIGFGTGQVTGEFARDRVCLASVDAAADQTDNDTNDTNAEAGLALAMEPNDTICMDMHIVVAVEMTAQPFKSFHFDGILGLGLSALALSDEFSAFELMSRKVGSPRFGAFLTEGAEEQEEDSEIAFGGHNPARLLEPLSWVDVAMPELGYWQVEIVAIRVGGRELDVCRDGTCRGVVDTGTSHLGIPAPHDTEVNDLLTVPAGDLLDCRLAPAPEVQIELRNVNLTLHSYNYMRRLPLREGINVGSAHGVHIDKGAATTPSGEGAAASAAAAPQASPPVASASGGASVASPTAEEDQADPKRFCRPRTMPVRLPEPLGPKLFILGEPVLHRYYTVYDWKNLQVGFGLANTRRNSQEPGQVTDQRGSLPKEVEMLLMQQKVDRTSGLPQLGKAGEAPSAPGGAAAAPAVAPAGGFAGAGSVGDDDEEEEAVLLQVRVSVVVQKRARGTMGGVQVVRAALP